MQTFIHVTICYDCAVSATMYADTRNRETLYGKYILNTTQYMVEK